MRIRTSQAGIYEQSMVSHRQPERFGPKLCGGPGRIRPKSLRLITPALSCESRADQLLLAGHYAKLRCGTDVQGTAIDSKGPVEADLIDAVCDPRPPNSRRAIRLWHPCVDVYVSNPQATVARSDRHGAGRKRGRAVAEVHARARGASADRVRGRAPWRSCPNRCGTRRRLAVAAIRGIRSRPRSWSATACRHDRGHVARSPAKIGRAHV